MKPAHIALVATALLTVVNGAHAAEPAGGVAMVGTMRQGVMTMDYFAGPWDCAGTFPSTGKPIASTIRFHYDLDGKVLVKRHDDRPPSGYHALELWVYQPKDAAYNAAIADSFGGVRDFHSAGWKGDDLVWQSGAGITPIQRFAYHRIDGNTFRLDWDVSKDSKQYRVGDTLTCRRRAETAS